MMVKLCSCCSRPAEFSFVSVVSTVNASQRMQKCSSAVLFCGGCFQKHLTGERLDTDTLRDAVNSALTRLNADLRERSTSGDAPGGGPKKGV
jgi:hypothetical protein